MKIVLRLFKGVLMGIANIIPGVSGGTMAVSMGIFDRMISAISELTQKPRQSLGYLAPIFLGMGLGIVGFTYVIEYLLRQFALPTCLAFIGLILGGLPMLVHAYKTSLRKADRGISPGDAVVFFALLLVVIFLPMLETTESAATVFGTDAITLGSLFVVGIIASGTMVVPGISGSLVMMILGYYYGIIGTLKGFFDAVGQGDPKACLQLGFPLLFFGIGVLAGIFWVAKCIKFLFSRFACSTYAGIIGLILASPFAILYNTGALEDLLLPGAVVRVLLGMVLLSVCGVFTHCFSKVTQHED